jgi:Tfp pilus assembly protein PilV
MRNRRGQRGATLIEAMAAMGIVLVAALGTVGLHTHQLDMTSEARRATEATAIAKDMVENMSLWKWDDDRLSNADTTNDTSLGSPPFDHADADLGTWTGIPTANLPAGFERYWNVAVTGRAKKVAVIVRWPHRGGWHSVVTYTIRGDLAGGGAL